MQHLVIAMLAVLQATGLKNCQSTPHVSPIVTIDSINLQTPENGNAYTKSEVVNIMSKVPVGDVRSRAAMIKVILEHQKKYSVPCSQTTIYCLMKNHGKGQTSKEVDDHQYAVILT